MVIASISFLFAGSFLSTSYRARGGRVGRDGTIESGRVQVKEGVKKERGERGWALEKKDRMSRHVR